MMNEKARTKKTKIVATLGPASSDREVIKQMILEGVNVCRLNFSHGDHETKVKLIKTIRDINAELGTNVAVLADLQGPKLRIGNMEEDQVLETGSTITISTDDFVGTKDKISINYMQFPSDVKPGEKVLLDDGKLVLTILSSDGEKEVKAEVTHGGVLSSKKGFNLPHTNISLPCLTEKDLVDLHFALEQEVDWIGLSFVRSGRDIIELKHLIKKSGKSTRIIAKIEKPEALDDIDSIVKETDGLMVARGDLGVETPMENVPLIQKMIVRKALRCAKPVIIATQMMESMITNISPTRAEVNDVANAVLDGADAVMLSGETSVGNHPIEVIKSMTLIVKQCETESQIYYRETLPERNQNRFITDSICFNATRLAKRVEAKAIITMTHSGYTAYKISSQRPNSHIVVFTGNRRIMSQLSLVWGVSCYFYDKMVSTDHTIADIKYLLHKNGVLQEGDMVINIASMPIEEKGQSNMIKLSHV